MGGRTGKAINYFGAAPGAAEGGTTPQATVSQGNTSPQQSAAQVSQGQQTNAAPTVQQG
jgi:hypothetical protein